MYEPEIELAQTNTHTWLEEDRQSDRLGTESQKQQCKWSEKTKKYRWGSWLSPSPSLKQIENCRYVGMISPDILPTHE